MRRSTAKNRILKIEPALGPALARARDPRADGRDLGERLGVVRAAAREQRDVLLVGLPLFLFSPTKKRREAYAGGGRPARETAPPGRAPIWGAPPLPIRSGPSRGSPSACAEESLKIELGGGGGGGEVLIFF